jgi:hypothetical protein
VTRRSKDDDKLARKPAPPPRVIVEYDTSPEAQVAYVGAVRRLLDWTLERLDRPARDE